MCSFYRVCFTNRSQRITIIIPNLQTNYTGLKWVNKIPEPSTDTERRTYVTEETASLISVLPDLSLKMMKKKMLAWKVGIITSIQPHRNTPRRCQGISLGNLWQSHYEEQHFHWFCVTWFHSLSIFPTSTIRKCTEDIHSFCLSIRKRREEASSSDL